MTDEELLEYISESSTMSKAMDEYEGESPSAASSGSGMTFDEPLQRQRLLMCNPLMNLIVRHCQGVSVIASQFGAVL